MKTSRVSKVYPNFVNGSMTKTSKFIHFLIRICFLSVTQKNNKISFNKYKICIYILVTICWLIIIAIVSFIIGFNELTETYNKEVIQRKKPENITLVISSNVTISFSVVPYKK